MTYSEPERVTATELQVLVVDDNVPSQHLAIRILEAGGYRGVAVANAREARRELAAAAYRAVLIDVQMPGESGIELLRTVRADYPGTAPIMVTASVDPETVELSRALGARAYVVKPYRIDELLGIVADAVHMGPEGGGGPRSGGEA